MGNWNPVITASGFTQGNGLFDGRYSVDGVGLVRFEGRMCMGSSTVLGSGSVRLSLPVPPATSTIGHIIGVWTTEFVDFPDNYFVPRFLFLTPTGAEPRHVNGTGVSVGVLLDVDCKILVSGSYWAA